jgi:hypothetical protein
MTETVPTVTVTQGQDCVTLIATFFTANKQEQDYIVQTIIDLTEEVMKHQPGYISTIVHQSFDGSAVVNYVQWRTAQHLEASLQLPGTLEHIKLLRGKYRRESALHKVTYLYTAQATS